MTSIRNPMAVRDRDIRRQVRDLQRGGPASLGDIAAYVERDDPTELTYTTTSTSGALLDLTNLAQVLFQGPPGGFVVVDMEALAGVSTAGIAMIWSVYSIIDDVPILVTDSEQTVTKVTNGVRVRYRKRLAVTHGVDYQWAWGWRLGSAGTGTIYYGSTAGAATLSVTVA